MRRVPIRTKLAGALAVPLLALLVVTSIEMASIRAEVAEIDDQTQLARAAVGPAGVITRLQDERSWPALELTGAQDLIEVAVEDYDESRRLTDEAIADFRAELQRRGPSAEAAYASALDGLDALDQLRADIDADQSSPLHGESANNAFATGIYDRYSALIRPFFDATDDVAMGIDDLELRRGVEMANTCSRQIEVFVALARELLVSDTTGGGVDTPEEIRRIADLKVLWDASAAEIDRVTAPYDAVVEAHYPHEFVEGFTALADRALAGEAIDFYDLMAPFEAPDKGGLEGFRVAMADELNATADSTHADARSRERVFLILAATTLAAAFLLTWLVSRSITGPLRSLTRQAKQMAGHTLPAGVSEVLRTPLGEDVVMPRIEPVQVNTRDEVSDVAAALTTVQDTALDLAVEQAVLRRNLADSFVNLGRRNQNLLGRQIDYITEFESSETDPDALANLFRLDHLATRMRRNAESLLVLAGVEPSRQWMSPVQLNDVVRAALGEVEDYQRVALRGFEPVTILGSAAADLAHLLAELIENALVFSPSDRAVDVHGRNRADGGYSLAVVDGGMGMAPDALAAANRRLAGVESFTVAPSKYLGHYVAGNLAARHGITVALGPGPEGYGTLAMIDLPPDLVVATGADPVVMPTAVPQPGPALGPPGGRGWRAGSARMGGPTTGV